MFRSIVIWRIKTKNEAEFHCILIHTWNCACRKISWFCMFNLCSTDSFWICCSVFILWSWSLNHPSYSDFCLFNRTELNFSPWNLCDICSSDSCCRCSSCLSLSSWSLCNLCSSVSCTLTCSYLPHCPWGLCDLQIITLTAAHHWSSVHQVLANFTPKFTDYFWRCTAKAVSILKMISSSEVFLLNNMWPSIFTLSIESQCQAIWSASAKYFPWPVRYS